MRLPFVSRDLYESVLAGESDAEKRCIIAEARAAKFETLYGDLVKEMLAMKREGFGSAPKPQPVVQPKATPSDEAIAMRAGTNGLLRAHLTRWRDSQKVLGVEENALAERVLRWTDPDERDD